jgi:hypothetical protein
MPRPTWKSRATWSASFRRPGALSGSTRQRQAGENWEDELRKAVEERCGLFLSIISDHTGVRLEGYNIFERNLAAQMP